MERVVAGSADYLVDGQVFLELLTSAVGDIDDYRETLPTGRVLLFLDDRSHVESTGRTGAPAGAPIFGLASPLGIILEDGGRIVGGYEDLGDAPPAWMEQPSFDEFVAAIGG